MQVRTPRPNGDRLAKVLQTYFTWQRHQVLADLHRAKSYRKSDDLPSRFVNDADWDREMYKQCQPVIQVEFENGGQSLVQQVGLSDDVFDVQHPQNKQAIKDLTLRFCKTTNESTTLQLNSALSQLRKDFEEGITSGERMSQLADRVSDVFDKAEDFRAGRIAITETSRAHSEGTRAAAKESGVCKGFRLLPASDCCDICQDVAAQQGDGVDLDGSFADKAGNEEYPDSLVPLHPNCVCSVEVVLEDETGIPQDDEEANKPDDEEEDKPEEDKPEEESPEPEAEPEPAQEPEQPAPEPVDTDEQKRQDLHDKFAQWMDDHNIPADKAEQYKAAIKETLAAMNTTCLDRVAAHVTNTVFHPDMKSLRGELKARYPKKNVSGAAGYFSFRPVDGGPGTLVLDGGANTGDRTSFSTNFIYAHELSHCVDGGHYQFSGSAEWHGIWAGEIKPGDRLTAYASTLPQEGWAEYGRLVFTDKDKAKNDYPQAWKFWKNHGLVDDDEGN